MVDKPYFMFTDVDEERIAERWSFQPVIQHAMVCLPLPIWFETPTECDDWIQELLDGLQPKVDL